MTAPTLTVPIREVSDATPRSKIVRLDLRGVGFSFQAGQAVIIGRHGLDRRLPYSIACAPEEADRHHWLELLVQSDRERRPANPLDGIHADALVDVDGPVGRFVFPRSPEERRFVFIAGGTGIAPLRAMLMHLLLDTSRPRPDYLGVMYSARTPDEFAYSAELMALADEGRIDLKCTVTRATPNGGWPGGRGRIDSNQLGSMVQDPATLCFVCGPPDLVRDVPLLLGDLGVSRQRVRIEEWAG